MIVYKATDKDGKTRNGMPWAVGVRNTAGGEGKKLCSPDVIHVYRTALQAAFMLPTHAGGYTRLWEVEVPEIVADDGTKCGVKSATVIREIPMPEMTTVQRVEIGIRVSLTVLYKEKQYVAWAEGWLSGKNRSSSAASVAASDSAYRVSRAAFHAGDVAFYAANAASDAANAAYEASTAAYAANAASDAANAASDAANAASGVLELLPIIDTVMGVS